MTKNIISTQAIIQQELPYWNDPDCLTNHRIVLKLRQIATLPPPFTVLWYSRRAHPEKWQASYDVNACEICSSGKMACNAWCKCLWNWHVHTWLKSHCITKFLLITLNISCVETASSVLWPCYMLTQACSPGWIFTLHLVSTICMRTYLLYRDTVTHTLDSTCNYPRKCFGKDL